MLIAREKKKNNIAEYILYMWQLEDMLRAMQMDIRQVERNVVSQFQVDEDTRKEIREWYDNLIEMMKREEVVKGGHLQVVKNMVNEQYERAKKILSEHREGHNQLAQLLIDKEVIFAEDVERIFGKRPWASRSEEIMAAKESQEAAEAEKRLAEEVKEKEKEIKEEEAENSTEEKETTEAKITVEGKVSIEKKVISAEGGKKTT